MEVSASAILLELREKVEDRRIALGSPISHIYIETGAQAALPEQFAIIREVPWLAAVVISIAFVGRNGNLLVHDLRGDTVQCSEAFGISE